MCFALVIDESLDMGGVLDPLALAVTAPMAGQYPRPIDDADPVGIGQHGQRSPHLAVWHRVIVLVEADVRCLADRDRHLLHHRIGIVRQLQKVGSFLSEGLADRESVLIRAAPVRRSAPAPGVGLCIEIIDIGKLAAGEEAIPNVAHGAFDPAFFVAAGDRDRARLVTIMPGEVEQGWD